MFSTFKLKKTWLLSLSSILILFGLIALTEVKQEQKNCQSIVIELDEVEGHQFITRRDVTGYLTNQGADPIIGEPYSQVDFRKLEKRLLKHGFIKNCQVSRDLMGNLIVSIEQPIPVARLMPYMERGRFMEGQYISTEGKRFPVSMNYTARVPILAGDYFRNRTTLTDSASRPLLNLLTYIRQEPFWQAQIVEVNVDENGNVTMWPLYGNHRIEIGIPTDLEMKFKKLKIFYKQILPLKDAALYSRINIQYRNQIVCE